MIQYVTGNIFDSGAKWLVNTVNCEGYMGKGVAYQFKLRFPENNRDYVRACKSGELHIGSIHYYYENGVGIVNFPTKDKWRDKSKIEYVEVGLDRLVDMIAEMKPESIAIPPLGCGNGGLDWREVKTVIDKKLSAVNESCKIKVFEPSHNYGAIPKEAPKVNVSSLVLLKIKMHLDRFGALRLQKTCFFMNYFLGEEYFKFDKWHYGPYSDSIRVVAKNIKEYQQYYNIRNTFQTYDQIYNEICSKKTDDKLTKLEPAIKEAADFVNSVMLDKDLEGIATTLYIVQHNNENLDDDKIIHHFKQWSEDKAKRFTEKDIRGYIEYLDCSDIMKKNICGLYEIIK